MSLKSVLPFPFRSSYRPSPSRSQGVSGDDVRAPVLSPEEEMNSIGNGQTGDWAAGSSAGKGDGLVDEESSAGNGQTGDWAAGSSAGNGEGFDEPPESSNGEIYPITGSSENGHNSCPAAPDINKRTLMYRAGAIHRYLSRVIIFATLIVRSPGCVGHRDTPRHVHPALSYDSFSPLSLYIFSSPDQRSIHKPYNPPNPVHQKNALKMTIPGNEGGKPAQETVCNSPFFSIITR
jgi:hypothetical protein